MNKFRARIAMLIGEHCSATAETSSRLRSSAETPTGGDDTTAERATPRAHARKDALYLITLVAALGGFGLIGRDAGTLWISPDKTAGIVSSEPRSRASATVAPKDARAWGEAVASCATPGARTRAFVTSFPGSPAERMAAIFEWVAEHWHYEADRDQDWLVTAESLLDQRELRGDCKSIGILLFACSAQLGINARIVATKGSYGGAGHLQAQILISSPNQDPGPTLRAMTAVWKSPGHHAVSERDLPLELAAEGWYLQLDGGVPPARVDNLGPVELIITPTGLKLNKEKEERKLP